MPLTANWLGKPQKKGPFLVDMSAKKITFFCGFPKTPRKSLLEMNNEKLTINMRTQDCKKVAKFSHPALSSELYNYVLNTEFVAAVGIL